MMEQAAETQSCDPQFVEAELPCRVWGPDRLSAAAVEVCQRVFGGKRSWTSHSWRLERLLTLASNEFLRGQWGLFLTSWASTKRGLPPRSGSGKSDGAVSAAD